MMLGSDSMLGPLVLVLHALSVGYMTGLIWFVQIVHYPLMSSVGVEGYVAYQAAHMRSTTWVVSPMILELLCAVGLFFLPLEVPTFQLAIGLSLLVLVWLSTALLAVPAHQRLTGGFEPHAHRRLVLTNWVRTAGWSLRLALSGWWLLVEMRA